MARKFVKSAICVAAFVICSSIFHPAFGTYAAMYFSHDFAVIGLDSRVTDTNGNVVSDQFCKIHPIGQKLIFFGVGIENIPLGSGIFERSEMLADEAARASASMDIGAIADRWTDSMKSIVSNIADPALIHHVMSGSGNFGHEIADGTFVGTTSDGPIYGVMESIRIDASGRRIQASDIGTIAQNNVTYSYGMDAIYSNFERSHYVDSLKRSGLAPIEFWTTYIDTLLFYVIKWGGRNEIGGTPAVVRLQRGMSLEWIRRPAFCR